MPPRTDGIVANLCRPTVKCRRGPAGFAGIFPPNPVLGRGLPRKSPTRPKRQKTISSPSSSYSSMRQWLGSSSMPKVLYHYLPISASHPLLVYSTRMDASRREKDEVFLPFLPFPKNRLQTERDGIEEALRPCSSFKSPLSWEERMDVRIAQLGAKMSSHKDAVLFTDGVPPNWSALVRYLHAQGIT